MKAERKFWTDAMAETVRPEIDLKVKVGDSGIIRGPFDTSWYDIKSTTSPQGNGINTKFYANMLNGNGFKLGDSRCVLNNSSETFYTPYGADAAAVSNVSSETVTVMCVSALATQIASAPHRIRLWNVKDVTLTIDALDNPTPTANVLDTATINIALDDYTEEYIVEINLSDIFPSWDDRTYHGVRTSYTIPNGDRLIFAGYFYSDMLYLSLGVQDIVSLNYDEGLELVSGEVPHQTLSLTIYDEAGDFDPTNPNGYYDLLKNRMSGVFYIGVDGAYLSPTHLYSTGDVNYSRRQLTIEFDTDWQTDSNTSYVPAKYIGNIGDDLQMYTVWSGGSVNNSLSAYQTNASLASPQWNGEISQLRLSSVGGFAFYNETYSMAGARLGCKATELENLEAQDYHVVPTDLKDTYATLERKPLLGDVKVTKYRYYISNESKSVSTTDTNIRAQTSVVVDLPEWCRHGARFDMSSLSAVDENGNTIPQASLNWTIQESSLYGVQIYVSHTDNVTKLISASLTGTIYYWAQEVLSVTTETVNSGGEECAIDNPFVTTDKQVKAVIDSIKYIYGHRDTYRAQWAQDWRVELGDIIYLDTQFETDVKCVVTGLKFSYPGLWGEITMRRLE